eukprot:5963812-Amphidinium_carterae.1
MTPPTYTQHRGPCILPRLVTLLLGFQKLPSAPRWNQGSHRRNVASRRTTAPLGYWPSKQAATGGRISRKEVKLSSYLSDRAVLILGPHGKDNLHPSTSTKPDVGPRGRRREPLTPFGKRKLRLQSCLQAKKAASETFGQSKNVSKKKHSPVMRHPSGLEEHKETGLVLQLTCKRSLLRKNLLHCCQEIAAGDFGRRWRRCCSNSIRIAR